MLQKILKNMDTQKEDTQQQNCSLGHGNVLGFTHTHSYILYIYIYMYTYTHIHIYTCMCIYIHIFMYVCVASQMKPRSQDSKLPFNNLVDSLTIYHDLVLLSVGGFYFLATLKSELTVSLASANEIQGNRCEALLCEMIRASA